MIEQLYQKSSQLSNSAQKLTEELFKFNPAFEGDNGKESLATLAGMARALEESYSQLWIDLVKQHEREQLIIK